MVLPLAELANVLRRAGVPVVEYPGWKDRTQKDGPFSPLGVMWHHDASARGDSPGVPAMMANLANNGAQTWVDRYGVWHLIAAGRMWHAGTGTGFGRILAERGNTLALGVETDHTTGEDWPNDQLASLRLGTAAILAWFGANPADSLCGHKEYRRSNPDPDGLDMATERRIVAQIIADGLNLEDDVTDRLAKDHILPPTGPDEYKRVPIPSYWNGPYGIAQGWNQYVTIIAGDKGVKVRLLTAEVRIPGKNSNPLLMPRDSVIEMNMDSGGILVPEATRQFVLEYNAPETGCAVAIEAIKP